MKEKLLLVTKGGEDCDKGFSYVLELAKSLNVGIAVLMVYGKRAMESFEDMMAAAAFAEAGRDLCISSNNYGVYILVHTRLIYKRLLDRSWSKGKEEKGGKITCMMLKS